jgi:RecA-family ATPase
MIEAEQQRDFPRRLDLRELANRTPPVPAFIVPDWLPQNAVTLFAGDGGSGKSLIALQLAVCIAAGRSFMGLPVQRRRVAFLSLEDDQDKLHWRLANVCRWFDIELASLHDWLIVWDGERSEAALASETHDGLMFGPAYIWTATAMAETRAEVLVLDNASDSFDANENARRLVRRFFRMLRSLVPTTGAILLLAHVDKSAAKAGQTTHGFSGSTAWSNSARSRWYLRQDDDGESLVLELQKANHAKAGAAIRMRWNAEAHLFVGDLAFPATKLDRELAEADDREAVLQLIRDAYAACDPVPAAASGARTSWHVLRSYPSFPASLQGADGRRRTLALVQSLRSAGAIRAEIQKYGHRNTREVLCAA